MASHSTSVWAFVAYACLTYACPMSNSWELKASFPVQVLPPLKYIIGRNKPFNFLVRNKWRNHETISHSFIKETPTLLLSSLQVLYSREHLQASLLVSGKPTYLTVCCGSAEQC